MRVPGERRSERRILCGTQRELTGQRGQALAASPRASPESRGDAASAGRRAITEASFRRSVAAATTHIFIHIMAKNEHYKRRF